MIICPEVTASSDVHDLPGRQADAAPRGHTQACVGRRKVTRERRMSPVFLGTRPAGWLPFGLENLKTNFEKGFPPKRQKAVTNRDTHGT